MIMSCTSLSLCNLHLLIFLMGSYFWMLIIIFFSRNYFLLSIYTFPCFLLQDFTAYKLLKLLLCLWLKKG